MLSLENSAMVSTLDRPSDTAMGTPMNSSVSTMIKRMMDSMVLVLHRVFVLGHKVFCLVAGDDVLALAGGDVIGRLQAAIGEQGQAGGQDQIGDPALHALLQTKTLLGPFGVAQVIQADADLEHFCPVIDGAAPGIDAQDLQPVGGEQSEGVNHAGQCCDHRHDARQARRQQVEHNVDAQMRVDLDGVAHAEQDQPGKQDAGEFECATPAGGKTVAHHHLGEAHQGQRGHQKRQRTLFKAGDGTGPPPLNQKQCPDQHCYNHDHLCHAALNVVVSPNGKIRGPCRAPDRRVYLVLAASAAAILSVPTSASNLAQTGFITATQAARCSSVSSRMVPPASRMFWRFLASCSATELLALTVASSAILRNWSRTSGSSDSSHSVEVTSR